MHPQQLAMRVQLNCLPARIELPDFLVPTACCKVPRPAVIVVCLTYLHQRCMVLLLVHLFLPLQALL